MEKTKLGAEQAREIANDREADLEGAIRPLAELEMLLVGGGDGTGGWP